MNISFYDIPNCSYDLYNGCPVLIAPPSQADPARLTQLGFVTLPDGRRCRYLTADENQFILNADPSRPIFFGYPNTPAPMMPQPETPADRQTANTMCFISVVLMALSILSRIAADSESQAAHYISGLTAAAAWVLMIIVRVKYPQSKFGKVLFIVYLVMAAIAIVLFILAVILLIYACSECMNEVQNCPG